MKKITSIIISICLLFSFSLSVQADHNSNKNKNYKCEKIQKYYEKYLKKGKEKYLKKFEKKKAKYCPEIPSVSDIYKTSVVGGMIDLELKSGYILESNPTLGSLSNVTYYAGAIPGTDVFYYYVVVNGEKSNVGKITIEIFDGTDF